MLQRQIIRLIDVLAHASQRRPSTIGLYAAGSGDFYSRLLDGRDLTTRRAEKVVTWLSDHWPADLPWPADIPRPAPRPQPEKAA